MAHASLTSPGVSATVLNGFSDPEVVRQGLAGIGTGLEIEQGWYGNAYRYQNQADIQAGIARGDLVRVVADENLRPIGRFRNPELENTYPPYLTSAALACAQLVGRMWRREANNLRVPRNVVLSCTSFVRHEGYQAQLVAAGKYAVSKSIHPIGNALDIDLGGYYMDRDDTEVVVSLREPKAQLNIATAMAEDYGVERYDPPRLGPAHFNELVPKALKIALDRLQDEGALAWLNEMPGTANNVAHIAAAPDFAA